VWHHTPKSDRNVFCCHQPGCPAVTADMRTHVRPLRMDATGVHGGCPHHEPLHAGEVLGDGRRSGCHALACYQSGLHLAEAHLEAAQVALHTHASIWSGPAAVLIAEQSCSAVCWQVPTATQDCPGQIGLLAMAQPSSHCEQGHGKHETQVDG